MQIFVQTRGEARASDYRFLGQAPQSHWWRRYRDHTTFDHPTLLVQSDGARWQAYLSGIPSVRVDAVGTVARYTVVLEGACGAAETGPNNSALAVIEGWLSDIAQGVAGGQVQVALDREFPAPVVERLIAGEGDGVWHETQRRALAALGSLPVPHPVTNGSPRAWIGDIGAPTSRAEFLARTAALLTGEAGRALFLNLVGSQQDGTALDADELPVAILGEDVAGINRDHIAELNPKKASPPQRSALQAATATTKPRPSRGRWLVTPGRWLVSPGRWLVTRWQGIRRRIP
ncbi:MAG: hypothetical protein ABR608_05415 [Pseudonocardiaceae bacterium]